MHVDVRAKHIPKGNVFDTGRLAPSDAADSQRVWKDFIKVKLPLLNKHKPVMFSTNSERQFVCLLQKRSANLEFVILNAWAMLGKNWGFQIVTSPKLVSWVEQKIQKYQGIKILSTLKPGVEINKLMRKQEFWEQLDGESLLLIDTECIICHGEVDKFLEYDFVAPLWRKADVSPWCRYGGGVSLRKKSTMIKICRECNVNHMLIPMEPVFTSVMLRLQSNEYCLPDDAVASEFAVERCYSKRPFVLHKAWQFIRHQQLSHILDQFVLSQG